MLHKMKIRKFVAALLALTLFIGLCQGIALSTESRAAGYGLSNPKKASDGTVTYDCVWFGNYWQNDTNGDGTADTNDEKQPIKWRVLSVDGDDAFLVADQNLDVQNYGYYEANDSVIWETCEMRSWLNGYGASANKYGVDYRGNNFLDRAFSSVEQSAVKTTQVVNNDNPEYGTEGGNDTEDKVFLLSYDEVTNPEYGFSEDYSVKDNARVRTNTAYVAARGTIGTSNNLNSAGTAWWWLRSPGDVFDRAMLVNYYGNVYLDGESESYDKYAVCPALHLNLSSSNLWNYAGTVSTEGSMDEQTPTRVTTMPMATTAPSAVSSNGSATTPTVTPTATPTVNPVYGLSNPGKDSSGVVTYDCVWFGNYWQNDTNGDGKADTNDEKKPIKWRVLSVGGDDAFLMADQNLDVQRYYEKRTGVTWETCMMRSWLNGYDASANKYGADYRSDNFLDRAFTSVEQLAIQTTRVVNNDNPYYNTVGGNDTDDKVFLLSYDEATNPDYGFANDYSAYDNARVRKDTAYVAAGGTIGSSNRSSAGTADYWWLRSPGMNPSYVMVVCYNGYVLNEGIQLHSYSSDIVCPALHLKLSESNLWSYAGTVRTDGKVDETASPTATTVPPSQKPEEGTPTATTAPPSQKPEAGKPTAAPAETTATATSKPAVSDSSESKENSGTETQNIPSVSAVKGIKVTAGRKKLTLKWKKVSGAAGYQIQVSLRKKFKGAKKISVKKSAVKYVAKKLKRKKKYYIRIRAYKKYRKNNVNRKVYGKWSAVIKKKTK